MTMLCPPEYMVCFLHRLISALRYYWDEYKASNPHASFSEGERGRGLRVGCGRPRPLPCAFSPGRQAPCVLQPSPLSLGPHAQSLPAQPPAALCGECLCGLEVLGPLRLSCRAGSGLSHAPLRVATARNSPFLPVVPLWALA